MERAAESGITLTVFFDDPFWVGVFERVENGRLSVCKFTFGAEPRDGEILELIEKHYYALVFSPAVSASPRKAADNPKRRAREARRQTQASGVGTKSQQALAAAREQMKTERRQITREQKEAEAARRYDLRQQKKKEKHRGR